MSSLKLLLQLLLLVSSVTALNFGNTYRYYGGSVTFTPKGTDSNGKYEVVIRTKQTHFSCNQDGYVCDSGDCGSQISTVTGNVSANSSGLTWCHQETVMTRKLPMNRLFSIKYPKNIDPATGQGFWIGNIYGALTGWTMVLDVDLGIRSDTGESNRSPITTTVPILRVPEKCPRKFNLTVFDPDGDQVRCRYAYVSGGECGICNQPAGFSIDQNSCLISYSKTSCSQSGLFPFELMFEDFPRKTITYSYNDGSISTKRPLDNVNSNESPLTIALSRLPLLFSIQVDSYDVQSCVDGDYFPKFLSPTPSNGERQNVSSNSMHQIKVKASARFATISDLIISGPKGIIKQKMSTEEYTIKWTPTDKEMNESFPICFLFEAGDQNNGIYHSEMRCVIVYVGPPPVLRRNQKLVETKVNCNDNKIKVEVKKSDDIKRNEAKLHLRSSSDPDCKLSKLSNSTHLVAIMSLNTCGTTLEEDGDNLIYKNEITSANTSQAIYRQEEIVEIVFSCVYPKRVKFTLGFKHKNPYAVTEKGFGAFSFQFEFFENQQFTKQKDPSTYPVEVNLKEMIFMEIEATTSIPNTELFVESCKATPYDNPNSAVNYAIIENGCKKDNTVQIYSSSKSKFKFGMEAFEFIGDHEKVYITCSVMLCETGVSGTRCSEGCKSNSGSKRRRREATAQTARHFISQGPLHLIKTLDGQVSHPSLSLSMNVIFIVGCLLVCGALIYRSRTSKVKCQPLPN